MATWPDIQIYLREKYTLSDDASDVLSMVWSYQGGRSQKIVVRKFRVFDRDMLELKSPFAKSSDVTAEDMVRINAKLPLATVALSGNVYLAVYNMIIDNLHMDDLDVAVSRVAALADALEKQYARRDEF